MEPKAHHVIIGFFTLAAVSAALLFALWLGKSSTDTNWAYYRIGLITRLAGWPRVTRSSIPASRWATCWILPWRRTTPPMCGYW